MRLSYLYNGNSSTWNTLLYTEYGPNLFHLPVPDQCWGSFFNTILFLKVKWHYILSFSYVLAYTFEDAGSFI